MANYETQRILQLKPYTDEAAIEIVELLEEVEFENVDILVDYTLGTIKIKIYGPKPFVKKAVNKIKQYYKVIENKYKKDKGLYKYNFRDLETYFGVTIPKTILLGVLTDKNHKLEIVSDLVFKTSATLEEIRSIIFEAHYLKNMCKGLCASKTLSDTIVRLAIVLNRDPIDILQEAKEKKLVREREDMKYELACSPEKILKTFLENR